MNATLKICINDDFNLSKSIRSTQLKIQNLKALLNSIPCNKNNSSKIRFILIKNLSYDMIKILGLMFSLDLNVFLDHLQNIEFKFVWPIHMSENNILWKSQESRNLFKLPKFFD